MSCNSFEYSKFENLQVMKDLIHKITLVICHGHNICKGKNRKKIKNNLSNAVLVKSTLYFLVIFKIYDNTDFCKSFRWWLDLLPIYETMTAETFKYSKSCGILRSLFWECRRSNNRTTEFVHKKIILRDLRFAVFHRCGWHVLDLWEYRTS